MARRGSLGAPAASAMRAVSSVTVSYRAAAKAAGRGLSQGSPPGEPHICQRREHSATERLPAGLGQLAGRHDAHARHAHLRYADLAALEAAAAAAAAVGMAASAAKAAIRRSTQLSNSVNTTQLGTGDQSAERQQGLPHSH